MLPLAVSLGFLSRAGFNDIRKDHERYLCCCLAFILHKNVQNIFIDGGIERRYTTTGYSRPATTSGEKWRKETSLPQPTYHIPTSESENNTKRQLRKLGCAERYDRESSSRGTKCQSVADNGVGN